MPSEDIRRRLAADPRLYPELVARQPNRAVSRDDSPGIVSIASTTSTSGSSKPKGRDLIVIPSSDEDDESDFESAPPATNFTRPPTTIQQPNYIMPGTHQQPAARSTIPGSAYSPPTNLPLPIPARHTSGSYDRLSNGESEFLTAEERERALKDLMHGMDQEDTNEDIDENDAIVKGFKKNIKLLPHQVIGRKWMADRETEKRRGGILADDMGLGKTIQTLTRIVEGTKPLTYDDAKDEGRAGTTLIVCPLALLGQWASEIKKMCINVAVLEHHGASRSPDASKLKKVNVVLTTYDVVKSEHALHEKTGQPEIKSKKKNSDSSDESDFRRYAPVKKPTGKMPKTALFNIKWWRVVLDEGHNIKNRTTKAAVACTALDARFRWVLSGTPMQNDVTDLYSLFRFLKLRPYNDWSKFDSEIAKPLKSGRYAGTAMKKLQVIIKSVMLKRKKTDTLNGKPLIILPARTVEILSCPFNTIEQTFYTALETKMGTLLEKLQAKGNANYTYVLVLLLRLRQACDHPALVSKDYKKDVEGIESIAVKEGADIDADADDLVAAFGQLGVTRKCLMCQTPMKESAPVGQKHCDLCRPLVVQAAELEADTDGSSAKIRMILKLLDDIDDRSEGTEKTIIFSQFTTMLDLIQPFLSDRGIRFVRYDGSMQKDERERSLKMIQDSSSIRVILISFKAGSTGLNLTSCNNVILVDLWWNPALEEQAFDRAHRLGQTRDVNIWKLKIDNSVEDRILELQEKKRALTAAALSGDKIKNMRLGMNELLALFRPGGRDDDDDDDSSDE